MSDPEHLNRVLCVIPKYEDLYHEPATFEDLGKLVARYPLLDWLQFLARIQTLIAPPYETDVARQRALYEGLTGARTRAALGEWAGQNRRGNPSILMCVEPQVSILQQIAVLHADDGPEGSLVGPTAWDEMWDALYMTWSLMHGGFEEPKGTEAVAALYQDVLRRADEELPVIATRAYHAYELGERTVSPDVERLHGEFERATGVSMQDYVIGGLRVLFEEMLRSPADIASGWHTAPSPDHARNEYDATCLRSFYRLRCADLPTLKATIVEHDGDRPICEHSLMALSRFPLVQLENGRRFVLNVPRTTRALFQGVRRAIDESPPQNAGQPISARELGGVHGEVIEQYVGKLLNATFGGGRVVKIERSNVERRADFIVFYPERVLLIEVKGSQGREEKRTRPKSFAEREAELEKFKLSRAAKQIASTIRQLRSGALVPDGCLRYDWATVQIVPVIITAEKLPLMPGAWSGLDELTDALHRVETPTQLCRVRFLTLHDVERMQELADVADVGEVLLRWANDPDTFDAPLTHFLDRHNIALSRNHLKERYVTVLGWLADKLDFDKLKAQLQKVRCEQ